MHDQSSGLLLAPITPIRSCTLLNHTNILKKIIINSRDWNSELDLFGYAAIPKAFYFYLYNEEWLCDSLTCRSIFYGLSLEKCQHYCVNLLGSIIWKCRTSNSLLMLAYAHSCLVSLFSPHIYPQSLTVLWHGCPYYQAFKRYLIPNLRGSIIITPKLATITYCLMLWLRKVCSFLHHMFACRRGDVCMYRSGALFCLLLNLIVWWRTLYTISTPISLHVHSVYTFCY